MTPVVFTFLTPDGKPVANADVEIQLMQPGFDPAETGILMPRLVQVTTDSSGEVTVPLHVSDIPYQVLALDPESEAVLSYKFIVPALDENVGSVRLQDIIYEGGMPAEVPYDQAALTLILGAKANAVGASVEALESQRAAEYAQQEAEAAAYDANASANRVLGEADRATVARQGAEAAEGRTNTSASAAATSAAASANSATQSAGSASNSATSAAASLASQNAAKISETNAKTSETNAKTSETNAAASATASEVSRQAAATQAAASAGSAQTADSHRANAANSASNAAGSASTASTKAGEAAGSATAAATSASQAATSATNASTSAGQAATSLTNATTQANLAKDWATKIGGEVVPGQGNSAKQSALDAAASATAAAQSKTNAATSETNAANSASAASTSAGTANQRAVDAATSKAGADAAAQLAQDWAIKDTSPNNTTSKSAKKYAEDAAASALSAQNAAEASVKGQINADWSVTDPASKAFIVNKPVIPAAQIQSDWNQTDNTKPDFIKNKVAAAVRATFAVGVGSSVSAVDFRNVANPSTQMGYAGGVRFRFGSLNDDSASPWADIIDLSTYTDASGGGVNALYLGKNSHRAYHKYAAPGATAWQTRTLAYLEEVLPLTGGVLSGGLSLGPAADLHLRATAGGDAGDIVFDNPDGSEKHRIWDGGPNLNYRYNGGAGQYILHTGNINNYAAALSGANLFSGPGSFRAFSIRTSDAGGNNWSWFTLGGTSDSAGGVWHVATNGTATDIGAAQALHFRGANGGLTTMALNQDHSVRFRSTDVALNGNQVVHAGNVSNYALTYTGHVGQLNNGRGWDVSNTNLNALTQTGFYVGSNLTNAPDAGWYYIVVESHDNPGLGGVGWVKQTLTAYGANNNVLAGTTYIRMRTGQVTWNAFTKLFDGNGYTTDYTIKRRRNRYNVADGTSLNNINQPETGFDYDTAGAGITGPFLHFGGLSGFGDYGCQIVASYNASGNVIKFRTRNDDATVWNNWKEFWHTGNLTMTSANTPSTGVMRDVNGYIYVQHINTIDDSNNGVGGTGNATPVTAIMVKQGDNWHRGVNAQYVKNFLGLDLFNNGLLVATSDFNYNKTAGVYGCLNGLVNKPSGSSDYGTLFIGTHSARDTGTQIYCDYAQSRMYMRSWGPGGFTPWIRLASANNDVYSNPTFGGTTSVAGSVVGGLVAVGTGTVIDCSTGNAFTVTVNGVVTLTTANVPAGEYVARLYVTHTSGSLAITNGIWSGGVAPTLTTGKVHMIEISTINQGATWRLTAAPNYAS